MDNKTQKFIDLNLNSINKLNSFIDVNDKDIKHIFVSVEMFNYFKEFADSEVICDDIVTYKGKRIIQDGYLPQGYVSFALLSNAIKFHL